MIDRGSYDSRKDGVLYNFGELDVWTYYEDTKESNMMCDSIVMSTITKIGFYLYNSKQKSAIEADGHESRFPQCSLVDFNLSLDGV